MSFRYQIVARPDDNQTYLVTSPAFPEVTTFGANEGECVVRGAAAIEEAIAARMASGAEIPDDNTLVSPDPRNRILFASVPTMTELKVDLYRAVRAAGVNRAELMRRLGWQRTSVDRLFQIDHASKLDQIEAAFRALGLEVRVQVGESERV